MPGRELHGQPFDLIDLTSDTENAPSPSQTGDLTVLDELGSPSSSSLDSNLDVDGSTPSLTSSYSQKEGSVLSPNTREGDGGNSTDDGLTLSSILAQSRKCRLDFDKIRRQWPEIDEPSISLAKEAFQSFCRSHPPKADSKYWTIYEPVSTPPIFTFRQPMHGPKDENSELTVHPNKQPDGLPLNTGRDETLGCNDEDKHGNKTASPRNGIKGHVPERTSSDDVPCDSQDHTNKETEPAKTSNTDVGLEQHAIKRPRLEKPKDATLDEVTHTSTNDDDGTNILTTNNTVEVNGHRCSTQYEVARSGSSDADSVTYIRTKVSQRAASVASHSNRDDITANCRARNARAGETSGREGSIIQIDRSNVPSQARPMSHAFDDRASNTTSEHPGRWRPGKPITACQSTATQGRPRPSRSASGGSYAGHKRVTREHERQPAPASRKTSNRQGFGRTNSQQQIREPVESIEGQWGTIQQRRQPSPVEDIQHILTQPELTADQQKTHREKVSRASTQALAQQELDDIFDADIPADPSLTTLDVQRAHEGHEDTPAGTREPTIVGESMIRQLRERHARKYGQQQRPQRSWSQPKPQPKPSTIKLPTTDPARHEPRKPPYATRNETFADAAASFNLLQSQYEKKRTTTILDSVPADFGLPSRESRMRAAYKARNSGRDPRRRAKEAERKRIRHREIALARKREELENHYAYETEANRGLLISAELDKCRRKYAENDRRRKAQAQNYLTVDFLEDGVGADDDAEVDSNEGGSGQRRGAAIRPEGLIPASQALEPNERIVTYAVYISEPYDQDEGYENHMQRTAEAFLIKDEANAFAQKLLTDSSQGWPGVRYDADANGLLVGHKRLPNGKIVSCMVQREMQVYGLLDTRNKWVKEEVKDLYRPRFDVFYTNVVPKVFLEKEEQDKQRRKDQKAKEVAAEAEAAEKPEAGEEKEDARGRGESPRQGLVEVLESVEDVEGGEEDRNSLFSSSPTPELETAQEADNEHSSQGGGGGGGGSVDVDDDKDTASIASDVTLKPDRPGGALGALSWTDVEFQTIHAGSYTDLRLANLAAFKVARLVWQPRTARHYAWEHYDYAVVPSIREGMKEWDLDADRAEIEFEVPEVDGLVDHRPWLFVHSRVFVVEAKLEGPRDIGCDFVVFHGEDE